MSIDERELRSRLAGLAALASPPRFTSDELTRSVRRIRRRRRRAGLGGVLSMAVVAAAIAIPLTHGRPNPDLGATGIPALQPLPYIVTVNGQTRVRTDGADPVPDFTVFRGRTVTIKVKVLVPRSRPLKELRLGITNGVLNGHLKPPLAVSAPGLLRPGPHQFVLHWNVPTGLPPGADRQLSLEWRYKDPHYGRTQGFVAEFVVTLPPATTSGSAAARLLRTLALRTVTSCHGEAPRSILVVRTTFGKATAVTGSSPGYAANAAQAVYLVVVKGDLTFRGEVVRPSCQDLSEPYFLAIVDAATFVILDDSLSLYPPKGPLSALGPVLNLTHHG